MTDPTTELRETLAALLHVYPMSATDHRADFAAGNAGLPWAVYDSETDNILGTGATESEALADAIETVRGWDRG